MTPAAAYLAKLEGNQIGVPDFQSKSRGSSEVKLFYELLGGTKHFMGKTS